MNNPLISILVPVYNSETSISRCLESIFVAVSKVSHQKLELIIVNDCSSDNSKNLITQLLEHCSIPSKIIDLEENSGVGFARNTGLENANGEFIHYIDSDDTITENLYEKVIPILESENIDILLFAYNIYEDSNLLWSYELPFEGVLDSKETLTLYTENKINPATWNKLFKKELFNNNRFSNKRDLLFEDLELTPILFQEATKCYGLNEALYLYNQESTSLMRSKELIQYIDSTYWALKNLCQNIQNEKNKSTIFINQWKYVLKEWQIKGENLTIALEKIIELIQDYNLEIHPDENFRELIETINKQGYSIEPKKLNELKYQIYLLTKMKNPSTPLISVIVPVYNVEKYVIPCLESVVAAIERANDYSFEIVCVDDCGQDNSIKKIEKFKQKYPDLIRIYKNDVNKGLGGARNTGIENAKGEFLQFVDSDDWLNEDTFIQTIPTLLEKPEHVIIYGLESIKNKKKTWEIIPKVEGDFSVDQTLEFISYDEINVSACNKIFPKKLFENLSFSEGMIYEDLDLIPLVIQKSKGAHFMRAPFYNYRQDGESLTRTATSDKHIQNGAKAINRLITELNNDVFKSDIFLNRWAYFLNKWVLSDQQTKTVFELIIEAFDKFTLKEYCPKQCKLFIDAINNKKEIVGHKKILELKLSFFRALENINENQPIFSIVSPVYNNEEFLDRFFNSINKDYNPFFELILVDDISTDRSFEIIQEFSKDSSNVHSYQLPEKGGAGGARNFGLEKSKGRYLIFWDSDDWIEKEYFELIIDPLLIQNQPEMIVHSFQVVNEKNETEWTSTKISNLPYFNYSGTQTFNLFVDQVINPSPWNKVIRRDLFNDEKIRFPEHIFHQDLALIPYLFFISENISIVKRPLYNYFINSEGITKTASQKHIDSIFKAVEFLTERIKESGKEYQNQDIIKLSLLNFHYNLSLRKDEYSNEQILSFTEQFKKALKPLKVNVLTLVSENSGRELYMMLRHEFHTRGLEFDLDKELEPVNTDEYITLIDQLTRQNRLGLGGDGSSIGSGNNIAINNLQNSIDWYSRTYDHVPKWYLKPAGVFRRIPFKKK